MKKENRCLALSFVIPFTIMGTVFALNGVYPFGGRQIIIRDFWHQYYPFLSSLWHKLREGAVSPWSWTAGTGHDYVAHIAYYLASPLNVLIALFPHSLLREALTLLALIKIGCAGLFMAMYLRYVCKQSDHFAYGWRALAFFSSLYALCAFILGYFWNFMWLDTIALLPLVMLGFHALMNEGKYRLYVISLALAIMTNYYKGLYICIFVVIAFINHYIVHKYTLKEFLCKLKITAVFSIIAIGLTAILAVPALSALQNIYRVEAAGSFPSRLAVFNSFFSVIGNFIAFTPPTYHLEDGLPNLYSGMSCIMLAGMFFVSSKIPRREKIALGGTLVFLIIGTNVNVLYFILNGLRFPNMIPGRFTFLVSFVLVAIAYRAYRLTENMSRRDLLAMGASAAVVLLSAVLGSQEKAFIIGSAVICAVYLVIFYGMYLCKGKAKQLLMAVLLLVITAELSVTSFIAVKTVRLPGRDAYPDSYEQVQALLQQRQPPGSGFYRTDVNVFFTHNDPSLYNYHGFSIFSSNIEHNITRFYAGLGLQSGGGGNTMYVYNETTPFANALLNMRYMIAIDADPACNGLLWETAAQAGHAQLLENRYYLPLGFMVNEGMVGYVPSASNSFLSQNTMFRRATGLDGSLFTVANVTNSAPVSINERQGTAVWDYTMPSDGILYTYIIDDNYGVIAVALNGEYLQHIYLPVNMRYITALGSFSQGDVVSFLADTEALVYLGILDLDLFEQGYSLLASQPLNLTHFSDTLVRGHVTAHEDGLLYTSIPGNKNWNAYVNGEKSEIVLIDNAMIAVRLGEGTHEVEFRYFNQSLVIGLIISLVSLAVFAVMAVRKYSLGWKKIIKNAMVV